MKGPKKVNENQDNEIIELTTKGKMSIKSMVGEREERRDEEGT